MIVKAYKFRLYPTEEQKVLLSKHFGCVRLTYNWALDYKTKHYKETKENIHWKFLSSSKDFFNYKNENSFIKEVNSQSIISAIGNLDNAYKNFFEGRAEFPKHKEKHNKQSFQVPQHGKIDIKKGLLLIPKFKGGIKCIFHREIPNGKHGTYTVSKNRAGEYHVSVMIHTDIKPKDKLPMKNAIGLDFGLKTFITTSKGESIKSPLFFKKSKRKLRIKQRQLSKTKKHGKNRNKKRIKVARLYNKITNQRQDFLHKLSHKLISDNQIDTICIEDLNIEAMKKLWGNKISDLSWYTFTTMLAYKADLYGKNIIKIGRFDPSSKLCSKCGHIYRNLSLKERTWTCSSCHTTHNRDINAAINIRDFGMNKYQLSREPTDVMPLEKKALARRNRKKSSSETGFDELGKKKFFLEPKPIRSLVGG